MQTSYGFFWQWALLNDLECDTMRQGMHFIHDQYDDDHPKTMEDRDRDKAAMRLALCPPEEAAFLKFWQTIYQWGWATYCYPQVPRPFARLFTLYDPEEMGGNTQLQVLANFYGTILVASLVHPTYGWESSCVKVRASLEELIVVAVSMGTEVHRGSGGRTPLQIVLSSFASGWSCYQSRPPMRELKWALLTWVEVLQHAAVDLIEYGSEEKRLCDAYRLKHSTTSPLSTYCGVGFDETDHVLSFEFVYGPTPSDWDVILLGFVEELFGDFWQLVETQMEEFLYRSVYSLADGQVKSELSRSHSCKSIFHCCPCPVLIQKLELCNKSLPFISL